MSTTNFPGGITSMGVILPAFIGPIPTGKTFFVSSTTGNDGNNGKTTAKPFATLATALSKGVAGRGDVIYLMPQHAETIVAAGGIAVNVEGVTIVGCGNGDDRPTFTFGTLTTATMTITAAEVTMRNFITVCNVASLVSPIVISAANCFLDQYEHQDTSASVTALRAVLTTAGATNLRINMKYVGFTATALCVNAIRLVGVAGALINMDFYGKASTAVVEFLTTLCTNIEVYGFMYNASVTDGSKDVVDTVGASLWFGSVFDGTAGGVFGGGSGAAWGATVYTNTAVGTSFWIKKTLTSSGITQVGVDISLASTGGNLAIRDVICQTNATGLAAMTLFTIVTNNANGVLAFFSTSAASLGASLTVDMAGASGAKIHTVLETGKKLTAKATVADGTGAGTVDVYIRFERLTAGATVAAA